jgi:transcriptional regulator with XRE-family HTH domain
MNTLASSRSPVAEVLSTNVIITRAQRKLSQAALAKRAGISRVTLSKIEGGDSDPTIGTVARIAAALDVALSDLFVGDDEGFADDNELRRIAKENSREGAVDGETLFAAIDEAAGHNPERYSNAGRPRLPR